MKYLKYLGIFAALALVVAFIAAPAEAQALFGLDTKELVSAGVIGGNTSLAYVSVAAIKRVRGANPGGVVKTYVIDKDDITLIPAVGPDGVTITTAITVKDGKGFALWDFAQDTGDFNFKLSGDPGSQAFEHTIGLYIPRFTPEIAAVYNNLPNGEFIIIQEDANGQKVIHGDLTRPLVPNLDYKSGKKFTDKNGSEVGFSAGNGHVPYFYTAAIPLLPVVPETPPEEPEGGV